MAAYTKLAENEMNYYQFKAKQILQRKKEEIEWQDFCKQIAPDCPACCGEKSDIKESKDIGIQTFPKKPILKTSEDKAFFESKYQKEEIPEALINIKTRLEKIDLALTKLFGETENATEKHVFLGKKTVMQGRGLITPRFSSQQAVKIFEEKKKLQIQNAYKASLQNSGTIVHKKPLAVKHRTPSFFLPHDLEAKRSAARKAYLASLQNVPKVSFQSKRQSSHEKVKNSQSKRNVSTRKKILPKKENQKLNKVKEETLIEAFVADDTKDENIEGIADAIFEDLLGETALDLNRIRQTKREKYFNALNETVDKVKKPSIVYYPSTSPSIKIDDFKLAANNSSIMKLKMFIDSYEVIEKENNLREEKTELVGESTKVPNIEDSKSMHDKRPIMISSLQRKEVVPKTMPKFVCDVTQIIKMDPEEAKEISSNRDRFWRYLKSISRIAKGDFNPWILNASLAESIIDDCINDVAGELSELPSSIIQELYNQEFVQQVEV